MNFIGFLTLLRKEIDRIIRVGAQTILSPIVTTVLYFLVFGAAIGSQIKDVDGITYIQYIVPGLIMMNILANAFTNSAFSLFMAKFQGSINDVLVTPISYLEMAFAYTIAAMFRALVTGAIIFVIALIFTAISVEHAFFTVFFAILVSMTFAIFGVIIGIISKSFDNVSIVPTFVITPLSFLGGVFYSIQFLPEFWQKVSLANPFLYMIDGLRFGFFGASDISPWISVGVTGGLFILFSAIAWQMLRVGYKLKD